MTVKPSEYLDLITLAAETLTSDIYLNNLLEDVTNKLEYTAGDMTEKEYFDIHFEDMPEHALLVLIITAINSEKVGTHDWNCEYDDRDGEALYFLRLLERIGYVPSDEETAYINGSHELFAKDEKIEEAAEYEM